MFGAPGVVAVVSVLPVLGAGFVALQVWRTAHRPDLPSFTNQDISGTFGDPAAPPLRIVAVGDSSLTAPGVDDLDDVWLRRLARTYTDRHLVELISLGVGGSRARDVVEGQLDAAVALRPDVAVVTVGGNDAIRAQPVRRYAAALETIVGRLEEASGAALLVGVGDLGTIPRLPSSLRSYLSRRSRIFDQACLRVAVSHPRTVKTQARRPTAQAFRTDLSLFAPDQFHASAAGHALFAETVAPALAAAYRIALHRGLDLPDG
ncbi:MAG TPA: SGNH/GDSL hydrolase family protein [Acidimicrobiia bacterium]|nr:SGNH/GDSL hydrolase family protein [Acidimicrobiia bacterium]